MRSIMPSLVSQLLAIGRMDLVVRSRTVTRSSGKRLALGVEPERHRRAGAKTGEHEIVRTRPAVEPADVRRLVGEEPVRARP